ncbi:RNA polymerase sigma factor [Portibacter lacus]|uniref:RNA polymerase sigma24 factor n=1 Tax=Portibacter lacus TaxID=1099794 RepID=A0AA37WDM3_9BACT|nr:sigma-70 family RNA polymerase sigma factor [Portibacter lacus]GLR17068.1 RNA polymerase sigma24 factor [Portibacter lacus]
MDLLTDESLINKVQNGQLDACGLLYMRYKKPLFNYFYNNIYDVTKSEDMVQTVFEKVIKYKKNFKGTGSFRSWLFTIARNTYIDDFNARKKNRSVDIMDHDFAHEEHGENQMLDQEESNLLQKALRMLDDEKRELISMIKLNEMKYQQVADLYGLSLSNVKTKVFRIMQELKENAHKLQANG